MSVEDQKQLLIEHGYLNLDELQVNGQGILADLQIYGLYKAYSYWFFLLALHLVCLTVLVLIQIRTPGLNEAFFFWLVVLGGVTLYCAKNIQDLFLDIREGRVKAITGILYKKYTLTRVPHNGRGNRLAACTIRIQKLVFTISPTLYDLLEHEEKYRLYFVPRTKQIVSVEPY